MLPVLIGIVIGYIVSAVYPPCSPRIPLATSTSNAIGNASIVGVPTFSFPDFSQFGTTLSLFFFIPVILVPRSRYVYAISGIMKRDLSRCSAARSWATASARRSAACWAPGETTYAENIG